MFKECGRRTTYDGRRRRRRTDNGACLNYRLAYEPKGSGELIISRLDLVIRPKARITLSAIQYNNRANSSYTGQNMQGPPLSPTPPSMGGAIANGYGYCQPMTALLNSPPVSSYHISSSTASSGSYPYPYPQQYHNHQLQPNAGNSDVMRFFANIDMKLTEVNRQLQTLDIVEIKR